MPCEDKFERNVIVYSESKLHNHVLFENERFEFPDIALKLSIQIFAIIGLLFQ